MFINAIPTLPSSYANKDSPGALCSKAGKPWIKGLRLNVKGGCWLRFKLRQHLGLGAQHANSCSLRLDVHESFSSRYPLGLVLNLEDHERPSLRFPLSERPARETLRDPHFRSHLNRDIVQSDSPNLGHLTIPDSYTRFARIKFCRDAELRRDGARRCTPRRLQLSILCDPPYPPLPTTQSLLSAAGPPCQYLGAMPSVGL